MPASSSLTERTRTGASLHSRSPFQDRETVHVGQTKIKQDDGRPAIGNFRQTLLAGLGFVNLVVLTFERNAQEPANLDFIVDDERDWFHAVASDGSCIGSPIGSRMEKRAPPVGRFCASI